MIRIALCLALTLFSLMRCAVAAEETVKIAYLVPLSGPFANVGETQRPHRGSRSDDASAMPDATAGTALRRRPRWSCRLSSPARRLQRG